MQFVITTTRDFRELADVLADVEKAARESGMFIFSDSDLRFETPQIEFNIDHDKANRLGITMADIGNSLATLLGGNYVNLFDLYGRSYQVIPQVPREFRLNEEWLTRYQIRTSAGTLVPLSNVASVTRVVQPNSLTNFQQLNSATLSAVPFPGRTVGEAIDFLKKQAENFPEGFTYDFQGESRQFVQEGNTLVYTFVFALIVIFLVLAAQYESFRDPFIILIALPTSIFGALIPLNAGLGTINIYTQIGLVTLIGLISKHGILMVDFANKLQEEKGYDRREAIEEAAALRLRPILMTTAATVVAMVPLLIAGRRGGGQPLRHRRGDRRRHDDRHVVHPVRYAGGLYLPGQRPPEGEGGYSRVCRGGRGGADGTPRSGRFSPPQGRLSLCRPGGRGRRVLSPPRPTPSLRPPPLPRAKAMNAGRRSAQDGGGGFPPAAE